MQAGNMARRAGTAVAASAIFAIVASACCAAQAAPNTAPGADPQIAAMVPQTIRSRGVLTVGSDATYPPFESVDPRSHEIVGFDADVAQDIATLMGLKLRMVNASFDTLIPSLAAGKFDIAMSSIGDTKARENVVDLVTYYWNSTNALVPEGNPRHLATNTLCGAAVGVERGTLQHTTMLPELNKACVGQGKPAIRSVVFKATTDAVLALASSRIDAVLADAIPNDYAAAHSEGRMEVVGPPIRNTNPGGIAVPKGSGLQKPIQAALEKLMQDGTYMATVRKWHVEAIAIDTPAVNGARS